MKRTAAPVVSLLRKFTGPPRAEHRIARPAESGAHTAAFSRLEKYGEDQAKRHGHMQNGQYYRHFLTLFMFVPELIRAARMISRKSSPFRLAPPMRPPSMSGCENSSAALSGFTLPPYKIRVSCAHSKPKIPSSRSRMKACASWACPGVAVRPVPMAPHGFIRDDEAAGGRGGERALYREFHLMGDARERGPGPSRGKRLPEADDRHETARARRRRLAGDEGVSFSPIISRLSLCPRITWVAPASLSIETLTSPVYAPSG